MNAALIVGGAVVVVLGICAVMGRRAWARFGRLEVSVGSIDKAVNHRDPGQPPLGEQVDRTADEVSNLRREFTQRMDVTDRRLNNCEDGLKDICRRLETRSGKD